MKYFGMTTETEQAWCRNFTESFYTGSGEIVELGPWLGSLTISLATGLLRRKHILPSKYIYAYDKWIWEQYMDKYKTPSMTRKAGEPFLPDFKNRLGWLMPFVKIRGDLSRHGPFESPIELLVVDAMKSWPLANAILKNFYPRLIMEQGYLFHQDYVFWACPWIHMIQWLLRDYFWVQEEIPSATTMVFRARREIEPELLDGDYNFASFSESEIRDAFKHSRYLTQLRGWNQIDEAEKYMLKAREQAMAGLQVTQPPLPTTFF